RAGGDGVAGGGVEADRLDRRGLAGAGIEHAGGGDDGDRADLRRLAHRSDQPTGTNQQDAAAQDREERDQSTGTTPPSRLPGWDHRFVLLPASAPMNNPAKPDRLSRLRPWLRPPPRRARPRAVEFPASEVAPA